MRHKPKHRTGFCSTSRVRLVLYILALSLVGATLWLMFFTPPTTQETVVPITRPFSPRTVCPDGPLPVCGRDKRLVSGWRAEEFYRCASRETVTLKPRACF